MKRFGTFSFAVAAYLCISPTEVTAQGMCYYNAPPGTVAACGTGSGYYRPQPYTLSSRGVPVIRPNAYYASHGKNQKNWNQYYPDSNTYGQREPNPFNKKGQFSATRTIKHLYYTRVKRK